MGAISSRPASSFHARAGDYRGSTAANEPTFYATIKDMNNVEAIKGAVENLKNIKPDIFYQVINQARMSAIDDGKRDLADLLKPYLETKR